MLIRVIPAGDVALVGGSASKVDGDEYVRQKLSSRFKFFLGEWFLDRRLGIPYYQDVFVKNPDMLLVRSIFRQVVLGTPGIVSLPRFKALFDSATRKLSFDIGAQLELGQLLVVEPSEPLFILNTLRPTT